MNDRLPACIVFDLDGTLLHSLPGIECSVRAALARCHVAYRAVELRKLIGPPISTILSIVANTQDSGTLDLLVKAFRESYDAEGWRRTELFPDALRFLETLRGRGHRLFVVSNKPRHISLRILDHLQIRHFFEAIVTADSSSPSYASKAEMLRALATSHDFALHDALIVGDSMEDASAAAEVGASFALMTHGYGDCDSCACVPVQHRFEGFAEFLRLTSGELVHD